MRLNRSLFLAATLTASLLAACSSNNGDGDGGNNGDASTNNTGDGGTGGGGVCGNEIDLGVAGTRNGMTITYQGSTAGREDTLHPYGGCVETDSSEVVFKYRVPAGVTALRISTAGSGYDTALYVRENCSQAMDGQDVVCNNDSYEGEGTSEQASVYVTQSPPLVEGRVMFIVVDGNNASGNFTLTLEEIARGGMGQPCRPEDMQPRCDMGLACSTGGSADGTPLCVPVLADNAMCDTRGFLNTCGPNARCANDPSPAGEDRNPTVCALAGTRAGASCREGEPRCDSPFTCGRGDNPQCVRVLTTGTACDESGNTNACPTGETCSPLGAGGPAICHS